MLLVAAFALAASPDIPELARRGAPLVASCTSMAPIRRLVAGFGPADALLSRAGELEGPVSLAMWDKQHMELRMTAGGDGLRQPMREEAGMRVFGEGLVGADPILVDKGLAVLLQTQRGCGIWADIAHLPGDMAEKQEGQIVLLLPEQGGPARFGFTSTEWKGKPRAAKHLELDLASSTPPFALIVADAAVKSTPKDPKRRKQLRRLAATFPIDGFVGGVWLPEDGHPAEAAGSISLRSNLKAGAIAARIAVALDHGKIPHTREGDIVHFRVADVPQLREALAKNPAANTPATGFLGEVELWLLPQDGHLRFATTRAALDRLGRGQAMVSEEVRTKLQQDDVVVTIQANDKLSSTDKPVMITMRMSTGSAMGNIDIPAGYLDWEKLSGLLGGALPGVR